MNTNSAILRFCDEFSIECQRRLLSFRDTNISLILIDLTILSSLIDKPNIVEIDNRVGALIHQFRRLNLRDATSWYIPTLLILSMYVLTPYMGKIPSIFIYNTLLRDYLALELNYSVLELNIKLFIYYVLLYLTQVILGTILYYTTGYLISIQMNRRRNKLISLLNEFRQEIRSEQYNSYLLPEQIALTVKLIYHLRKQ